MTTFVKRGGRVVFFLLLIGAISSLPTRAQESRKNAVVRAVEKAGAAVVNVNTEEHVRGRVNPFSGWGNDFFEEFFGDFFESFPERDYKRQSLGSGVIIDPRGYILTNEHVISQASKIKVSLINNREYEAQLIGADPRSDLAVLKISASTSLPYLKMGRSDDLMIGETIIAIGNPFGLSHTVTTGVISAMHRSLKTDNRVYTDFIQLDASINPGNSGGPLLNINGELVGVNTAIYQQAQGIGFAIPIDRAKRIVRELIAHGEVKEIWLGLIVEDVTPRLARSLGYPQNYGVVVRRVHQRSPAEAAAFRPGDILTAIGRQKLGDKDVYLDLISSYGPNDTLQFTYFRQGREGRTSLVARVVPRELAEELGRDLLGISVNPLSRRFGPSKGVVVSNVQKNSPAGKIGIQAGDLIRQINKQRIEGLQDFRQAVLSLLNRNNALLLVQRGSYGYYVTLDL